MIAPMHRILNGTLGWLQLRSPSTNGELGECLRLDLSSADTVEVQHLARRLADVQQVDAEGRADHRLRQHLEQNAESLRSLHGYLTDSSLELSDSPGALWLLENHRFIEDQIDGAKRELVGKGARRPLLRSGSLSGHPRIYEVAREFVRRSEASLEAERLRKYLCAYQDVARLSLNELWAVPAMIRLAALQQLGEAAVLIHRRQREYEHGRRIGGRVLQSPVGPRTDRLDPIEALFRAARPMGSGLIAGVLKGVAGAPVEKAFRETLAKHLSERGMTIESQIAADCRDRMMHEQAVRVAVMCLRQMNLIDWKQLIEDTSIVERVLRQDPAKVYPRMDFDSRDRYRHRVEVLSRHSSLTEEEVARRAIAMAEEASRAVAGERSAAEPTRQAETHVGYYLVDDKSGELERQIHCRYSWREQVVRVIARIPFLCYVGGILLVWAATVLAAGGAVWYWGIWQEVGALGVCILLALFAVAATEFAITVVNWLCTLFVPPRPIMRLDFSAGIPGDYRTLVAVPSMLADEGTVRELVRQLEIRYLANRDQNLLFALLTDFPDANVEDLSGDRRILGLARSEIERLNDQYGGSGPTTFYLLHRPRKWNARQKAWMGEERKCGKLAALNRLILHGVREPFSHTVGELDRLRSVRFVITLDSDTQLPPGAGPELAGCLAHPLNRPLLDPQTRVIRRGHGILQPRVGATIPDSQRTVFCRLWSGEAGIDLYTRQISNVYQDLFGRGSYIGKGIYDVEAFDNSLRGRFPPNRILSHDLIEGCFARSGLVNDVQLFEDFPTTLLGEVARRHRWIRGDWQIASWVGPRVSTAGSSERNSLDALSRWKIFDNVRRSLVPAFWLAYLLTGWIVAPQWSGIWLFFVIGFVFGPWLVAVLHSLWQRPAEKPLRLHAWDTARDAGRTFGMEATNLTVLPYVVQVHLDAIIRALYRLLISGENLLEWQASGSTSRGARTWSEHYRKMAICPVLGTIGILLLTAVAPSQLPLVAPLLLLWIVAPGFGWAISQEYRRRWSTLNDSEVARYRRWARQTWHYFETSVTAADHWLPPDHVLDRPKRLAHRTSPTNIGMKLLADLAAADLGYLSPSSLLHRVGKTLQTLSTLERYRGHFYNWYNTNSLKPAESRYISSVDSGNLQGSLVTLQAALEELRGQEWMPPRILHGLQDTLAVIEHQRAANHRLPCDRFAIRLRQLQMECVADDRPDETKSARALCRLLCRIRSQAADLAQIADGEPTAVRECVRVFVRQVAEMHRHVAGLAFWAGYLPDDQCRGRVAESDGNACRCRQRKSQRRLGDTDSGAVEDSRRAIIAKFGKEMAQLDRGGSLQELGQLAQRVADAIGGRPPANGDTKCPEMAKNWMLGLRRSALATVKQVREQLRSAERAIRLCRECAEMDFRFLYHPQRKLLAVGYSVGRHCLDESYYDLLASEARLTSFFAVCNGQLPLEHWFNLGRSVAVVERSPVLVSWSGSMFEYLMPMLVLPTYRGTLLDMSCRAAVQRQIRYAAERGVPWGISESCHAEVEEDASYCYGPFGVPGLGFGLEPNDALVVAPYASALAAMVDAGRACRNLGQLEQLGAMSSCGFYDALDYSPGRGAVQPSLCRAVMTHHSGMTLVAIANVLCDGKIPKRLLASPQIAAHSILLQERLPRAIRPVTNLYLPTRRLPLRARMEGAESLRAQTPSQLPVPAPVTLIRGTQGSR